MSDRHRGFIVTFEDDMHEEYMDKLKIALACLKGVASVEPVVADARMLMTTVQVRRKMLNKLYEAMEPRGGE